MAKYRELKKQLADRVNVGEILPEEAHHQLKAFGGNLIAHEREHQEADRQDG